LSWLKKKEHDLRKKKNEDKLPSFKHNYPDIQKEFPVPDYVKRVDDFAKHYFNGDYVVDTDRAFKIPYSIDGQTTSLGHYLTFLLTEYETSKTKTFQDRYWSGFWLFQLITHAFAVNVIKMGDGLITKLKNCEIQNRQLKETKEKLEQRILELESDNEELQRALDIFGERVADIDE